MLRGRGHIDRPCDRPPSMIGRPHRAVQHHSCPRVDEQKSRALASAALACTEPNLRTPARHATVCRAIIASVKLSLLRPWPPYPNVRRYTLAINLVPLPMFAPQDPDGAADMP